MLPTTEQIHEIIYRCQHREDAMAGVTHVRRSPPDIETGIVYITPHIDLICTECQSYTDNLNATVAIASSICMVHGQHSLQIFRRLE